MQFKLAEDHYAEHKGKGFFDGLVGFLTSGPVIAMVSFLYILLNKYKHYITTPHSSKYNLTNYFRSGKERASLLPPVPSLEPPTPWTPPLAPSVVTMVLMLAGMLSFL